MKKVLMLSIFVLAVGLLIPTSVQAACPAGSSCLGTTVQDIPVGCKNMPGGYCATQYNYDSSVSCDSTCGFRSAGVKCASDATYPSCRFTTTSISGNCCSGGGGGGGGGGTGPGECPAGQRLQPDPAYAGRNPPYTSCQRTGCFPPNVFTSDLCGYDSRGRDKFRCYRYICVACTATAPAAPTLASPSDGNQQSNTSVTLLWNATSSWGTACSGANNQYEVFLEAGDTTPDTVVATVNSGTLSNTQNNLINGTTYYWKVRASNGQLSTDSATRSFTILNNQITGTVYNDTDGVCSTANPSNLGGGLGISWGTDSTTVNVNGTFTVTATGANPQNLALTGVPASYVCSPGCGNCPTRSGISYPSTGNNFFLTQSREAWWQAAGAGVYAGTTGAGTTIRSLIPSPSTRLIIPGTNGLAALVRASSGAPEIGAATQISETNWSAISRYKGKRMDYQFFAAQMGLTSSSPDDFSGDVLGKPTNDPSKDFWYQNGDATISDPWTVNSGESYVLLVNGNLQINANITVASGGFLAVISNGGITVSPDVTSLQGLYVMDELFTTETGGTESDAQLAIQGSIVTWGGVSLLRDLGASLNVTTPAERFSYRPDLLTNMPEKMKVFALRWQEVSPGTFGE